MNGLYILLSSQVTCLGDVIDNELKFEMNIRRLSSRYFYHLRQLRTVRRAPTVQTTRTLVHDFITSRVDYCCSILHGAGAVRPHSLQSVLDAAVPLIVGNRKFDPLTTSVRDELHWLRIQIVRSRPQKSTSNCSTPPCRAVCIGFIVNIVRIRAGLNVK